MKKKKSTPDKTRQRTDIRLQKMESEMGRVYKTDPALISIKNEYDKYMDMVLNRTKIAYVRFTSEKDVEHREELKKAYQEEIKDLTLRSPEYQKIIDKFTSVLAEVNQKALDVANDEMVDIYVDNYNAVSEDCRKVGIKVNG